MEEKLKLYKLLTEDNIVSVEWAKKYILNE